MFPLMRFKIKDKSMEPSLKQGDYVIVNRIFMSKPSKGDLVVIKHPREKGKFSIKRVSMITDSDEYYVVGDNKGYSQDSRHFGPVGKKSIIGKVWLHFR